MTLHRIDPVRRALTAAEMTAIVERIDAGRSTSDLLTVVVSSVYNTLLADRGLTLQTLPDGARVDPQQFQIPTSQWQAIAGVATGRAAAWGTGPELALELVNVLPGSYDDPAAPVPDLPRTDWRPDHLRLHVTRDAVDIIAAATKHVQTLAGYYGPTSQQHLEASTTWLAALSRLLSLSFGADTQVHPDNGTDNGTEDGHAGGHGGANGGGKGGGLSVLAHTGSGFTFGLIFHAASRRCLAGDGCTAAIADDGTAYATSSKSVVIEHVHEPSFPLDAPRPGYWGLHS